jgi:hypothetical protein
MRLALTDPLRDLRGRIWRRMRHPGWIRIEIALLVGVLVLAS